MYSWWNYQSFTQRDALNSYTKVSLSSRLNTFKLMTRSHLPVSINTPVLRTKNDLFYSMPALRTTFKNRNVSSVKLVLHQFLHLLSFANHIRTQNILQIDNLHSKRLIRYRYKTRGNKRDGILHKSREK